MSPIAHPKLDEDGSGCLVVLDNGSGNFTAVQVPTESPMTAIREALPYLEEHVVDDGRVTVMAFPDTSEAIDLDELLDELEE
jgi:hypothetical protein